MKYMIIEKFRDGDAKRVYQRYFEKGRMAPDGLVYIESWVDEEMTMCFQIMECLDPEIIYDWIKNWQDIVDFEIVPVITSEEAQKRIRKMI
jgi:hypothetical protein